MIKKFLYFSAAALLVFGCARGGRQNEYADTESGDEVYICTGPQSKRYHKDADCTGLSRCSGTIEQTSVEDAESIGRTPCRWCCE